MPLLSTLPVTSYTGQEQSFRWMLTTVDNPSYTPSDEESSRDAAQFVATGRTSWRTLTATAEAVWPSSLEAALLEALEKYHPDFVVGLADNRLGHFPMRNKYISEYIFETTGKRRTQKQVASRLQQLKITCTNETILRLIDCGCTSEPASASSQSGSCSGILQSPPADSQGQTSSSERISPLFIRIVLQNEIWPSSIPSVDFINKDSTYLQSIQLAPIASAPHGQLFCHPLSTVLSFLSGFVQFSSPFPLMSQSFFSVYLKGTRAPVHTEAAPLECISSPIQSTGWLYCSNLVPSFWGKLCSNPDASRYVILQTLEPMNSRRTPDANTSTRNISLIYMFSSSSQLSQKPPSTSTNSPPFDHSTLTSDSSILPFLWQPQHENLNVNNHYFSRPAPSYGDDITLDITTSTINSTPFSFASPQQHGPMNTEFPGVLTYAQAPLMS